MLHARILQTTCACEHSHALSHASRAVSRRVRAPGAGNAPRNAAPRARALDHRRGQRVSADIPAEAGWRESRALRRGRAEPRRAREQSCVARVLA
eukprot:6188750-Pleurochrysis_carterae.AAC.2